MEIFSPQAKNNLICHVGAQITALHLNSTDYYWVSEVGSR